MPHGGYHGVVKMGGKTVQQGSSSDGQGGQQGGGVYNPGGYDTEIDKNPPITVKNNIVPEDKNSKATTPLDEDDIREAYIAGSNVFIPRGEPGDSVQINREGIFGTGFDGTVRNTNSKRITDQPNDPSEAFLEGIQNQLYNLYGDSGNRYTAFSRKRPSGIDALVQYEDFPQIKPKPSQGFELFGQNISLPEMPLFGKPIKELSQSDLEKILDEVKKYEDGKPNYFEGIPGGFNIAKGMLNSISQGEERSGEFGGIKGSPTLEGLEKFIRTLDKDSNMLDSFKQADPAAYLGAFGLPQTSAGLDFFANMGLTGDKTTDAMVVEARERLAAAREATSDQGGGGEQTGITSIPSSNFINTITPDNMNIAKYPEGYGAFLLNPPAPVRPGTPTIQGFPDKDGDGVDDRYQTGPGIPRPGIENVGPLKPKTNLPAAFDYASMAPQFTGSQYTNQGVSPAFLENLRRFYG